MDAFTIVAYAGSFLMVLYFLLHLFQTAVLKKKLKAGVVDITLYTAAYLFVLIYSIGKRNYPLIIFFDKK